MYRFIPFSLFLWGLALPISFGQDKQADSRLLRFPTIHQDTVVFMQAGNLYSVSANGGVARQLTSHEGYEMFPRFSPDGKWLAFTGQYDGNTEVYVMPAEGGTPKRLTFSATLGRDDIADRMGPNNIVIGWKNNSKEIVFRSRMTSFNDFIGQLYTVSLEGGLPKQLPLPRGGFASFSADDTKMVYNRVFREFRTWKRYRGGMADEVWLHDFKAKTTVQLTDHPAQDIIPMWHEQKVYFISDREEKNKRFNLYSYDLSTKQTKQLTQFQEFDIKFPSLGAGGIVFENGGWIYKFDLKTEQATKISIRIINDGGLARGGLLDVSGEVNSFEISPDGKRALFSAHGELFTVPSGPGRTRALSQTSGVHERNPKWSPDGKTIAYISDASGEDEIYLVPHDGSSTPTQLTTNADTYKYELYWSPDGTKVAWSDKKLRLQYVDVKTKQVTVVHQAKAWEIRDYTWSPDSKWIAFAQEEEKTMSKVYLYALDTKKLIEATDGWFASSNPCFSRDGKFLFFSSARDFNPIYSATEWNHAYADMEKIYVIPLAKATPNPLKPLTDEERAVEAKPDTPVTVVVDENGLQQRTLVLPVASANYSNLQFAGDMLFYNRGGLKAPGGFFAFDMKSRKELSLGKSAGYEISADGKKMLVSRDGKYGIIDLPKGNIEFSPLSLTGMKVKINRLDEWKQIYHECWRQMRDFFYDPGMHGVDWLAVRKKYEVMLPYIQHRNDLTYLIGEMISELNVGHAYVGGGQVPTVERIKMGLLGAQLSQDKSGYYKIDKIMPGAAWDKKLRSPLAEPGVDISAGQYIVQVNGTPTNEVSNIYELLINTAETPVTLHINDTPVIKGARTVVVTPIADEAALYYHEWVQGNIKKVNEASKGEIGYIHVPDMLANGLNEFMKHYYPQLGKKALLIDMRGNGGGNVSPMLIERLRRQIAMVGMSRNTVPQINPEGTFYGPMACLLNEFSRFRW
ncbi:MAG: PDZ domain-containing protein [Zavarzinella sp.]